MNDHQRDTARRSGFLGTGLSAAVLFAIFTVSSVAFFFWGGALWRAQPGSSHVARIAGSYLIVIPLVAAALAASRRFSAQHLLGSVAAVWSAKLVITATSYTFIAPGSATEYAPARTWESKPAATADGTVPKRSAPPSKDESAAISAQILEGGAPLARAVVVFGDFEAAGAEDAPRDVPLVIEQSRYEKEIYVAASRDRMLATSRDGVLHTLRLLRDGSAVANVPLPPGPPRPVVVPPPGAYEMTCENHASERALLVVVDHKLVAMTDADGRFEMSRLPSGESDLVVLRPAKEPVRRHIQLAQDRVTALSIEIR